MAAMLLKLGAYSPGTFCNLHPRQVCPHTRVPSRIAQPGHERLVVYRQQLNTIICCSSAAGEGPGADGADAGGDGSSGGADIDQLAKLLSQQAAKIRSSMSDDELRRSYDGYADAPPAAKFGLQSAQLEARVLQEIGAGGFESDDFEVLQQLGRISVMREASASGNVEGATAVIAYAARFIPRLPMQRAATTLLKEYLPLAKAVAFNELLVLAKLCGLPDNVYTAANAPLLRSPPIVPLLGYFVSAPTEEAASLSMDQEADSIWLVYKWEGLKPLSMLLDVGPPRPVGGFFKSRQAAEQDGWLARTRLLKAVARGVLNAVAYCHRLGVVHGSLSTGTVFVSSTEDADADDLLVKLDNFGFGKLSPAGGPLGLATRRLDDKDGEAAARAAASLPAGAALPAEDRRTDLQGVALVLTEVFAAGCATSPSGQLSRPTLFRLLFEIYYDDMDAFREYCVNDPSGSFERLVAVLDANQRAGWDFLGKLVRGDRPAADMMMHGFLAL